MSNIYTPSNSPNSTMPPPSSTAASHASSRNNPPHLVASSSRRPAELRSDTFPFCFNRPYRANPSSTSLVPSIAEGKPIPLGNSTVEHCTSALREINSHYPSRHRYVKSSGAQSSTYSEPVIVRSYHPPASGRRPTRLKGVDCVSHSRSMSACTSEATNPTTFVRRSLPFASKVGSGGYGMLSAMALARANKSSVTQAQQETRLPPVEAFSFKSFLANVEAEGGVGDINADLDRIAEICARSRYSLSNQYEVHYPPHGSGASFMTAAQQHQDAQGPTLQAVSSDDEQSLKRQKRKSHDGRRNSRAIGTLETIISSSRSSEEERSKQRSAAELSDEVRGRTSKKEVEASSPTTSLRSPTDEAALHGQRPFHNAHARRPSTSLALIDGSRQISGPPNASETRSVASALVGEPAQPQESMSQLEIRTAPEDALGPPGLNKTTHHPTPGGRDLPTAKGSIPLWQEPRPGAGLRNVLGGWLPWVSSGKHDVRAERSLRHLLKTADHNKGKGVAKAS